MTGISEVLKKVRAGRLSVRKAAEILEKGHVDLLFAKVDTDRSRRKGLPEVIYCPGKTSRQIARIVKVLLDAGQQVLATRATPAQFKVVRRAVPRAVYHETARIITVDAGGVRKQSGAIAVVAAGTSDLPVAEEAALTAETMGVAVTRVYDVGVAGLHRLFSHLDRLRSVNALVVVAGMEGALPSVVGGLVDRPVVAVPTSIGYGTSFRGLAALLAMLNSCVPGVTVVNIDNGFGAGVAAALIARSAAAVAAGRAGDGGEDGRTGDGGRRRVGTGEQRCQ